MKIRVVELFAGVGGFRIGFENSDKDVFKTVWANQWEPGQKGQWAYKCYVHNFGDEANCSNADIATVIDEVPEHDLLVGGFPCQDYSVASTGAKGIEGKKGVLWWSIDRIIKKRHPSYVLLENVDRLLKSPAKQRGRDFGIILKCLQDEGYAIEWRVINAADYGHAQRRRRTFIFAVKQDTKQYKKMASSMVAEGAFNWISQNGFFANAFPVYHKHSEDKQATIASFKDYDGLVEVSDAFKANFYNAGVCFDGTIYSEELKPKEKNATPLSKIVEKGALDEHFFIPEEDLPKWQYMKGAKKIERTSRTGFTYSFSEGGIAFPDPLDKPARTMLTSEGSKNRSSHVIEDPLTKRYRILTPEECEAINGFPRGWTNTEMPEKQRYFIMGNALVVPLIKKMGDQLLKIV